MVAGGTRNLFVAFARCRSGDANAAARHGVLRTRNRNFRGLGRWRSSLEEPPNDATVNHTFYLARQRSRAIPASGLFDTRPTRRPRYEHRGLGTARNSRASRPVAAGNRRAA
jgi:hypothetical protein